MIRSGTVRQSAPGDEEFQVEASGGACTQVSLIEPYVGRRLRARTRRQFELHLFVCPQCLHAVEFELLVKRAISELGRFAQISRSWH